MREQIEAILSGVEDKHIKWVEPYWQIRVGSRAGARENGLGLAIDLLAEHQEASNHMQVGHMEEPADLEIPRFLAPPPEASVPLDLQALVEPGETTRGTQERLWKLYLELQSKIMMALASREEIRLHEDLHRHLNWLAEADERKL